MWAGGKVETVRRGKFSVEKVQLSEAADSFGDGTGEGE